MTLQNWIFFFVALAVFFIAGVLLMFRFLFTDRSELARSTTKRLTRYATNYVVEKAKLAWQRTKQWLFARQARKQDQAASPIVGTPRKRMILSNNWFWYLIIASVALSIVFGTQTTFVAWWPSNETWGAIAFWALVVLGVVTVLGLLLLLSWLKKKYFYDLDLRSTRIGKMVGTFITIFVGLMLLFSLIWITPAVWRFFFPPGKPANELVVTHTWTAPIRVPAGQKVLWFPRDNTSYEVRIPLGGEHYKIYSKGRDPVPDERDECEGRLWIKEKMPSFQLRLIDAEVRETTFEVNFYPYGSGAPCAETRVREETPEDDFPRLEDGIPKEKPQAEPSPLPSRPIVPPEALPPGKPEPLPSRPITESPFRIVSKATM